jgi:hypothetical protein
VVANLNFAIKAVNEAKAALSEVEGQLSSVEGKAGSSGGALSDMGGKLALVGTMAVAAGVGIASMIADKSIGAASELGTAVNSLAIATGLSDTKASEWIGTGEHFGLTADYMQKSMDKASKAIFGGIDPVTGLMVAGGKLDDTLTHYGITTKDASGKALDMNAIMLSTSDVFSKMPDGPEKTALALKLFGKAGVDMIPMLDQGSSGVQKLMGDVDAMGLTLDASGVAKTKAFAFAQRDMNESIKGVEVQIGMALMPTMTKMITFMSTTGIPVIKSLATDGVAFIKQKFDEWQPTLAAIWDIIANKIMPIVKDLTVIYLKALRSEFVDFMIPAMATLYGGFMNLLPAFKAVADFLNQNVIPVFVTIGGFLKDHPALLIALAAAIVLLVAPWLAVIAAWAGLAAIIIVVLAQWGDIKTMFTVTIPNAIDSVIAKITGIAVIGPMFQGMIDAVTLVVTTGFEWMKLYFKTQIDLVEGIIKLVLDLIHGDFGKFWTDLKALVGSMFDDIKGLFSIQLDLVKGLISTALTTWEGVITDAAGLFLAAGTAILTALYNGASDLVTNTILPWFTGLPGRFVGALGDLGSLLYQKGIDLLAGLKNGAVDMAGTLLVWVTGLPGQIKGWLGDLGSLLYDAGAKIIGGLLKGITDKFDSVKNFVGGIAGTIAGLKGPASVDAVLLVENGKLIMQSLIDGFQAKQSHLEMKLKEVTQTIVNGLNPDVTGAMGGVIAGVGPTGSGATSSPSIAANSTGRSTVAGGITLIINYSAPNALVVDGAAVTQAVKTVLPEIKRQLTMQGSWGMA